MNDLPGGKQQVLTMPKVEHGVRLSDWHTPNGTAVVRTAVAVSYALGGHMLVTGRGTAGGCQIMIM